MKRNALLARIHIAKARCMVCSRCGRLVFGTSCEGCGENTPLLPLPEERYRKLLMATGGAPSCRDISDSGLVLVMDLFDRAGFSKEYPCTSYESDEAKRRRRVMWAIRIRAPDVLGPGWEKRVEGFVRKNFDKPSLSFCDPNELRKVFGWINRTAKSKKRNSNEERT